jgi:hypothetical protein
MKDELELLECRKIVEISLPGCGHIFETRCAIADEVLTFYNQDDRILVKAATRSNLLKIKQLERPIREGALQGLVSKAIFLAVTNTFYNAEICGYNYDGL